MILKEEFENRNLSSKVDDCDFDSDPEEDEDLMDKALDTPDPHKAA